MRRSVRLFWPGLLLLSLAGGALAQGLPAPKPPRESPEAIVLRILASHRDGKPIPPEKMPLVPRLSDQLRRTDLAHDPVAEADGRPICCVIVDMAAGMGDKRVAVMGRFRHGAEEQVLTFDLDVTSGDWLITDIRPEGARPSLRRLLRLTR